MLNKKFKSAKCKTSLKLATSRIKLTKNKKAIQISQMKKELAQLLESGQDRTARIRVEHVIREEKMMAAYDLIEIYCELIVARLSIIESQKTCPIDLKEAVTSVIFAAPRCADLPELVDVKKIFTAKYGKEFVSAAIELRPDCGVSRMLVEKLSAVAPNVQTKMKVLGDVAKAHNVNWDQTLFEEKELKPTDDLLNGPTKFEKAGMVNADPIKTQTSNVQSVHNNEEIPNVPFDFSKQNKRYTLDGQTSFASTTHDDMRPPEKASEMMNTRHSFDSNIYNSSSSSQHWNMEFKDATSAAQAAAESAERASFAARAAAQLSSQGKITRQFSTESQKASTTSEFTGQRHFKDSYNNSFNDRNPKTQNQQTGPSENNPSPKAMRKQPSISDKHDVLTFDQQKASQRTVIDQGKTSSYGDDETDSDDDGPRFDTGIVYDEVEAKSFFPSPGRESIRPLEKPHIWSPKKNTSDPKYADHSVKSDISDGSYPESESEMVKSSFSRSKIDLFSPHLEPAHIESSPKVNSRKSRIELNDLLEDNSEFLNQSDGLDTGKDLNFETLTGGIRNKSDLKYPPYTKTASPSSKKPVVESQIKVNQSSFNSRSQVKVNQNSSNSRASRSDDKKPSVSNSTSESDSDDYTDKYRVQPSKAKSQFAPPNKFFNNDGNDSEEEVLPVRKPTSTSKVRLGSGLSWKTKDRAEPVARKQSPEPNNSDQQPNPPKKIVESSKTEAPKTMNLSSKTSLEETNNVKKPSHVHPKLPDYDSLAARFLALRTKHQ